MCTVTHNILSAKKLVWWKHVWWEKRIYCFCADFWISALKSLPTGWKPNHSTKQAVENNSLKLKSFRKSGEGKFSKWNACFDRASFPQNRLILNAALLGSYSRRSSETTGHMGLSNYGRCIFSFNSACWVIVSPPFLFVLGALGAFAWLGATCNASWGPVSSSFSVSFKVSILPWMVSKDSCEVTRNWLMESLEEVQIFFTATENSQHPRHHKVRHRAYYITYRLTSAPASWDLSSDSSFIRCLIFALEMKQCSSVIHVQKELAHDRTVLLVIHRITKNYMVTSVEQIAPFSWGWLCFDSQSPVVFAPLSLWN